MGTRLTDSRQYAHLWGTAELAQVFEERARLQSWLDILAALAAAQARLGIIPAEAAAAIAGRARAESLDLDFVAEQTRRTAHSMLGLIRGLQQVLPESAREHVYVGATVQDVTDTWFALVMRDVVALVWRDLRAIEESLVEIAVAHRDTVMVGRTHGQPGSPITFGFKVASWADEVRVTWIACGGTAALAGGPTGGGGRRARLLRAGGAGPAGGVLCRAGAGRSRDLMADLTRPGRGVRRCPVHDLRDAGAHRQRGLRTAASGDRGAARADHVRRGREHHHAPQTQPGGSEHLDTLARLVRANAGVLMEGMVVGHERDGRGWKAEWSALPEICLLTGTALDSARRLLSGLVVDVDAMRANVDRHGDRLASERLLAGLSERLGKHAAQQVMHEALRPGSSDARHIVDALVAAGAATEEECRGWLARPATGAAGVMVDTVVVRARAARAAEPDTWQ